MSASSRAAYGLLVAVALLATGCIEHGIKESMRRFDYGELEDPEPYVPTEGAIWPGRTGATSFVYFDNRARGVGDLITVVIDELATASGEANTDASRNSTIGASLSSDIGLVDLIAKPVRQLLRWILDEPTLPGVDPTPGTSYSLVDSSHENAFTGDGATSRRGTFQAVVTCRVVDVLPGGLFHVRGRRAIVVNKEKQYLTLEGLVRQQDISVDNQVASTRLAEAQLTYDGIGVLDDKQRPGFLTRVFDWVYPF